MNCLLIHNSHEHKGGDDTYVRFLIREGPAHGIYFHLLTIVGPASHPQYILNGATAQADHGFAQFLTTTCNALDISLINIQTLYVPTIARSCIATRPTVKTTHSTDTVCPGALKFWRRAETPCQVPYSAACYVRAHVQRCCSRNPIAFLKNYLRIQDECGRLARQYRRVIVMSQYVRRELISAGVAPGRIAVIPYATPVTALSAPSLDSEHVPTRLLYVGRLAAVKGVHTMLQALCPLLESRPHITLDIVGDGPERSSLQQRVDPSVSDRIRFHGWQDKTTVDSMLGEAHILVFPSIYPEAFGIAGIEAMMHGKPVVAFDVGGVREWLQEGVTGLLAPPGNTEALRTAVTRILDDKALYEQCAANARASAVASFRPAIHLTKLRAIFDSVGSEHISPELTT
jgi:glycosyltransferase involved in cell wall biosynthesis